MIKLGVFSKSINQLSNFEYRFYYWCMNKKWIDVELIIFDGRNKKEKNIFQKIFATNIFSKILFILANIVDQKFINYKLLSQNKKEKVKKWLYTKKQITIYPIDEKGNIDFFDKKISETINKFDLDLILRFNFNIIKGNILNIPKHGIWSFHHADNDINRGGPAGFWEVYNEEKNTGVTLQRLNNKLDAGLIIDKGFFVTQKTYKKNNIFIIEKSLIILIKNLKKLKINRVSYKKSIEYKNKIYKYPNSIFTIINYLFIVFKNILLKKIYYKLLFLLKYKIHHWVIYICDTNNFSDISLSQSTQVRTDKDSFLADPFFINYNQKDYVFYEKFSYSKNKGIIACSEIINNNFTNEKIILDESYHLSYPSIFKSNGKYYLIPEMSQAKKQHVYISKNFPYDWKLHKIIFKDIYSADVSILKYKDGQFWLFVSQSSDPFNDLNSELYIYKIINLDSFDLLPHLLNPVVIDSRKARNAGGFFEYKNNIIRPSQNTNSISYGNSLNFNKINKLSIDEYDEELVYNLSFNKTNIVGTHHFNMYREKSIIDVCLKKFKNL